MEIYINHGRRDQTCNFVEHAGEGVISVFPFLCSIKCTRHLSLNLSMNKFLSDDVFQPTMWPIHVCQNVESILVTEERGFPLNFSY